MSLVEIPVRPDRDPDGRRMRALLDAMFQAERAGVLRTLAIYALCALGLPLWVIAAVPDRMSAGTRTAVLAAYVLALCGAVLASIVAARRERLRERLMVENDAKVIDEEEAASPR